MLTKELMILQYLWALPRSCELHFDWCTERSIRMAFEWFDKGRIDYY